MINTNQDLHNQSHDVDSATKYSWKTNINPIYKNEVFIMQFSSCI